jgi:deoxyribonuclease-4
MLIGAHESVAGGYYKALLRGKEDGCECVQIFTRNPRGWRVKPLAQSDIKNWKEQENKTRIHPNVSHAIYLINVGHKLKSERNKSIFNLIIELKRAEKLGLLGVVLHPGSNNARNGCEIIGESINKAFANTKGLKIKLFLENVAGMGKSIGRTFEELRDIIKVVKNKKRVGVCLDTCHLLAGGYDIVKKQKKEKKVLKDFNKIIGNKYLYCFHLNDSKAKLDSRIDRHTPIGEGMIGLKAFKELVNNPLFKNLPGYIEMPAKVNGKSTYTPSIKKLKELRK